MGGAPFDQRHYALLFAWFARAAIDDFGRPGEQAVRRGVAGYGGGRGRAMASRAQADGFPNDIVSYAVYQDMPTGRDVIKVAQRSPHLEIQVHRCSLHEVWAQEQLLEYGRLYCEEIDAAVLHAFNPLLRFHAAALLTDGTSSACHFIYGNSRLSMRDTLRWARRRWRVRRRHGSVARGWEEHTTALFRHLTDALQRERHDTAAVVREAVQFQFAQRFGKDAAAVIVANHPPD